MRRHYTTTTTTVSPRNSTNTNQPFFFVPLFFIAFSLFSFRYFLLFPGPFSISVFMHQKQYAGAPPRLSDEESNQSICPSLNLPRLPPRSSLQKPIARNKHTGTKVFRCFPSVATYDDDVVSIDLGRHNNTADRVRDFCNAQKKTANQ